MYCQYYQKWQSLYIFLVVDLSDLIILIDFRDVDTH